jgi:AsmA family
VKFLFSRRAAAVVVALLVILFLFRPGVDRLRSRIAGSIGSALGRRVALDNVHLRLLPRPGFDLEGLVIYDDPAFSAEPMIRAQEVSAAIRLRSLLRGRIEISTLSATEPSINLVRNDQGRWNLSNLLERNAQIPAAPTEKRAFERRPSFPYLEASNARVNFKLGQTKKSYALMDADVALWQDSEDSWGARIKAEPVRTDFNLTDTGLLQINGVWQRASSLRSTPLQFTVQWRNGQLGQITKLLSGRDRGWRGGVNVTAKLSGTPEALQIESLTSIDGFHRYDMVGSENVRLATDCTGLYDAVTSSLANLLCESPVSSGTLRLHGKFALVEQIPTYDLALDAEKVPLNSIVRLLRQAKQQIPADLVASGLLNAEFHARRNAPSTSEAARIGANTQTQWTGAGSATNVRLSSDGRNAGKDKDEVTFENIPLAVVPVDSQAANPFHRLAKEEPEHEPSEPHLRIGPVAVTMKSSPPVNTGGWISADGYRFFLRGDMELKDLFRLEDVLGLPVLRPAAQGSAKLDVSVSGPWHGFSLAVTAGTAQLRNVLAEIRGFNAPIEITAATMTLAPDAVRLQKLSAHTGSTHWSGAVTAPRRCSANCIFQFDLMADQLSTGDLAEWFAPHPAQRPWYRILNSNTNANEGLGISSLLGIQAQGTLHVGRFGVKKAVASEVATHLEIDQGKITLTDLRAQILQGATQGNWTLDFSSHAPSSPESSNHETSIQPLRYHGSGTLHGISLERVSALMGEDWITGTADGNFDVEGAADNFHDLVARSDGNLQFVARNGSLTQIEIPGSSVPLSLHRFTGELHLNHGAWKLSAGRLESRDGVYQLSGTASPSSGFDFVLTRGDQQSWNLTGTLSEPRVAPVSRGEGDSTQADAKPVKP